MKNDSYVMIDEKIRLNDEFLNPHKILKAINYLQIQSSYCDSII